MSWKDNDQEQEIFSGGSGSIVRLAMKEGKYTIRILGTYKFFRMHWVEVANRPVFCQGGCILCQQGEKGHLRYAVNVLDKADGKVKLWEFGRRVKVAIQTIAEDYGNPNEYDLIITRKGTNANDTVYTVIPAREAKPLTEAENALPRPNLELLYANTPVEKIEAYLKGDVSKKDNTEAKDDTDAPRNTTEDLPTLG